MASGYRQTLAYVEVRNFGFIANAIVSQVTLG
jgi:hypothetical protein